MEAALQSITLLQNNPVQSLFDSAATAGAAVAAAAGGGGVLPLKKGLKLAVIGPHMNSTEKLLGNYIGTAVHSLALSLALSLAPLVSSPFLRLPFRRLPSLLTSRPPPQAVDASAPTVILVTKITTVSSRLSKPSPRLMLVAAPPAPLVVTSTTIHRASYR
jgi:hypothetical protein